METQTYLEPKANSPLPAGRPWAPMLSFARANFIGSIRNRLMMAAMLFTPVVLLIMFWLFSKAGPQAGEMATMLTFIFPSLLTFTMLQNGGMHTVTIVNWRERGIFRRLACTPTPLWQLVLARAIAQLIIAFFQGMLVLAFGALLLQIHVSWMGVLLALVVLALATSCFIALGGVCASLTRNSVIANSIYMFLVITMMFLGDFLTPTGLLSPQVQQVLMILPTAMIAALVRPLIITGMLPGDAVMPLLGLLLYTALFIAISIRTFRWA